MKRKEFKAKRNASFIAAALFGTAAVIFPSFFFAGITVAAIAFCLGVIFDLANQQ